jgi:hypothetical protein
MKKEKIPEETEAAPADKPVRPWKKIASAMNSVMGLEPAIDTTKSSLAEAGVMSELGNINPKDDFGDEGFTGPIAEHLQDLLTSMPKKGKAVKSEGKKKEKKEKVAKEPKAPRYPRDFSVIDALTKTPATIEELAKKSDALFVSKGGKSNTKQAAHITPLLVRILVYCGFAAEAKPGAFKRIA